MNVTTGHEGEPTMDADAIIGWGSDYTYHELATLEAEAAIERSAAR
jgi:hypothetical protein